MSDTLQEKIREARKDQDLTLRELSEKTDIPTATLKNIEYGQNMSLQNGLKIASVLNISKSEIEDWSQKKLEQKGQGTPR